MEMREGFMRPPRNRGGLMWPLLPIRGRNMIGMDRMRLPPLRPGLMRGGPPVPPFVGRGMTPPHARPPRGMGPGMLPRPPVHPPVTMGPLGQRGMLPRAILPPRPLGLDAGNLIESAQIPINGAMKEPLKNIKDCNILKTVTGPGSNSIANRMANNRSIKVHNRAKVNQNTGQSPLQNMHSAPHHPQPPVQQSSGINPPHMLKHVHPVQSQMNAGGNLQQAQPHQSQHQASLRGNRNGLNLRNRGVGGMGRGGLMNVPQMGAGVGNQGNPMLTRGAPMNHPPRGGQPVPPGRGSMMGGLPPPPVLYSSAPPPPPSSSYSVPPPVVGAQVPMKRGGPPMGMPPPMPPKRVRYDAPSPANGYGQYQQQPPAQPTYTSYDVPPPADVYSNAPQPPLNVPQSQGYNVPDYHYPPGPQNSSYIANAPYSSYTNDPNYSSYSGGSAAYDSAVEYHPASNGLSMNNSSADPYGYKAAEPADSYGGYSNMSYSNSQVGYDDYSSGYMDGSGYSAPIQDSSYGQSVGTYNNYLY